MSYELRTVLRLKTLCLTQGVGNRLYFVLLSLHFRSNLETGLREHLLGGCAGKNKLPETRVNKGLKNLRQKHVHIHFFNIFYKKKNNKKNKQNSQDIHTTSPILKSLKPKSDPFLFKGIMSACGCSGIDTKVDVELVCLH